MTSGLQPPSETLFGELAATADRLLVEHGVPGCALGVVTDGDLRTIGLGFASHETHQPVTTGTLFRLCSVTKPITAMLMMSLVQDGLVELDRPVTAYVPELPLADEAARATLTIRHLLSHTGGFECELPGDLERFGADDGALDRAIAEYGSLRQWLPPGAAFGYCNAGYWLAGAVAARVAGQPFELALRSRVLEPLRMSRTSFTAAEAILHPVALPHRARTPGQPEPQPVGSFGFPRARIPSGGLISSVDDLMRFATVHIGDADGSVISRTCLGQMRERQVPSSRPGAWQGLGWSIDARAGVDTFGHDGSYSGYNTVLLLVPSLGAALAVLTNGAEGWRVTEAIRDAFLDVLLGPAEPVAPSPIDLPQADVEGLAGAYADPAEPGSVVTVAPAPGGITLTWQGKGDERREEAARYLPISPIEFVEADKPLSFERVTFLLGGGGDRPIAVRIGERIGGRLAGTSSPE